jgi:hypothetical protein
MKIMSVPTSAGGYKDEISNGRIQSKRNFVFDTAGGESPFMAATLQSFPPLELENTQNVIKTSDTSIFNKASKDEALRQHSGEGMQSRLSSLM